MKKITIKTRMKTMLADVITPVGVYMNLRDRFAHSFLLESADYHAADNSFSYVCCDPIAFLRVEQGVAYCQMPGEPMKSGPMSDLRAALADFVGAFAHDEPNGRYIRSGLFGYLSYDAAHVFAGRKRQVGAPEAVAQYHLFRFVVALDHFRNECHVMEAFVDEPNDTLLNEVIRMVQRTATPCYPFEPVGEMMSAITDEEYRDMVEAGRRHCQLGDVFQVVLSRKFWVNFRGDDFEVYRRLRSINPSPYLFYFDYGNFRLFGSSPEAQLTLRHQRAEIHPIAGTIGRTGHDTADKLAAHQLLSDEKENSEHVMLVDLARNDLSRYCDEVHVERYREVQYYSHVIHMVSKVGGKLHPHTSFIDVVANTFPAGTLSGAPKVRAMELIHDYEVGPRGFYGGAVGVMDFDGNFNHAIMIRSMLSANNTLWFQAGAGVVAKSHPEKELQEVYQKVGALRRAIALAGHVEANYV